MKWYIAVALLSVGLASANNDVCSSNVIDACKPNNREVELACNSTLGVFKRAHDTTKDVKDGFVHAYYDLQSYVNFQLAASYRYLLLGTYFNSYQKNRPGFEKLFKELSEKAWDNAVALIKHITTRGGKADFNQKSAISIYKQNSKTKEMDKQIVEVDEFQSLALVLDSEKKLATDAHALHHSATHLKEHYDPEIAQYLEEKFLEEQSKTIRKLSGYVNDLEKLVQVGDPSLSIYLFDEYLQKQK